MRRQLSFAILAAASALLTFAGCAGSADPLQAVRDAATNTLGLSAQSTLTLTGSELFGGPQGVIIGRGEFSFPKGLGYAALQLPAVGGRAAGTAYAVYLPAQLWNRPVESTALPHGDLWVSAKFTDARSAGSTTPSLALELESMNPQLLLEEIAKGAVSARVSGHPVVNHVPLSEYVVAVDLVKALKAGGQGRALRTAMQQQLSALRASPGTPRGSLVRIVVRVNGAGRVAQLQASLPGSKLGPIQIGLSRFDSTIPLSLPLASETVDLGSFRRTHGNLTRAWMFTGS